MVTRWAALFAVLIVSGCASAPGGGLTGLGYAGKQEVLVAYPYRRGWCFIRYEDGLPFDEVCESGDDLRYSTNRGATGPKRFPAMYSGCSSTWPKTGISIEYYGIAVDHVVTRRQLVFPEDGIVLEHDDAVAVDRIGKRLTVALRACAEHAKVGDEVKRTAVTQDFRVGNIVGSDPHCETGCLVEALCSPTRS